MTSCGLLSSDDCRPHTTTQAQASTDRDSLCCQSPHSVAAGFAGRTGQAAVNSRCEPRYGRRRGCPPASTEFHNTMLVYTFGADGTVEVCGKLGRSTSAACIIVLLVANYPQYRPAAYTERHFHVFQYFIIFIIQPKFSCRLCLLCICLFVPSFAISDGSNIYSSVDDCRRHSVSTQYLSVNQWRTNHGSCHTLYNFYRVAQK